MTPRISVVVPAYNEGEAIIPFLDRLFEAVTLPLELLVVYDHPDDTTAPYLEKYAQDEKRLVPTLNRYHPGPAWAIRYGIDNSSADVIVITMSDGSDDLMQIDELARLVERGAVVAAASRYVRGGQQIGGPRFKGWLSRWAGMSLYLLARVGTHDPTSSFKAYSKDFIRRVGIESDSGFEVALELVAKARRYRKPVAEIPTVWRDRTQGASNFKLVRWLPKYLRWYLYAFGPRIRDDRRNGFET
jgi:dolichol-phosphate mannosyltransferase